ncbi:MAG: hypothetical protein IPL12_21420 [Bacteroidetes bacterium]|nr:hypothetical protein [Bacteroidota bacterium]
MWVSTKPANKFNTLFNRPGNGWTGGDATYSVALPDGRTVWMFMIHLDTVYADYSSTVQVLFEIHLWQAGPTMTTLCVIPTDAPQALVDTDNPSDEWYWPEMNRDWRKFIFVFFHVFYSHRTLLMVLILPMSAPI